MVEAHQREPIRILAYCVLSILRYVERNPLSARLVEKAELWRWGSLWSRARGGDAAMKALLSPWPVSRPANWTARVNVPLTTNEQGRVRVSIERVERGRPYGDDEWVRQTVKALNSEHTIRGEGRPRNANRSVTDSEG
jgi:putative transposase